jgi:hypothetical protein
MPLQISNPRRILCLGGPNSPVLALLHSLTGSAPSPIDNSTAGLSHTWSLSTQYYNVSLPIWIDEIPDISAWKADFLKPEAKEVVQAVGAWIYCFRKPVTEADVQVVEETMKTIMEVIERHMGYEWDGVCLAVAMKQSVVPGLDKTSEAWEDSCREYRFEFVDGEGNGRNEFGEVVGMERVREALETNEWESLYDADDLNLEDHEDEGPDTFGETFAAEEAEINLEWLGVKSAINGKEEMGEEDEKEQVEELERMMRKLQAIKGKLLLKF